MSNVDANLRQTHEVTNALQGVLGPGSAFVLFFQNSTGQISEVSQNTHAETRRALGEHLLGLRDLGEEGREAHVTPVS